MYSGRFDLSIDGNSKLFEREWIQNLKNSVTLNLKARLVMKVGKVTEILRSFISNVAEQYYRSVLMHNEAMASYNH